jgi:hypothetical protein
MIPGISFEAWAQVRHTIPGIPVSRQNPLDPREPFVVQASSVRAGCYTARWALFDAARYRRTGLCC